MHPLSRYCSTRCKNQYTYKANRQHYIDKATIWNKNNKSRHKEYVVKYEQNNAEAVKASKLKWSKANPHYNKDYYNKNRTRLLEAMGVYQKTHKDVVARRGARARAAKMKATPSWVDKDELIYIYKLAKERGLVVDHIVPLNSDKVCGLNCGDNLRCIPQKLNQSKGNRYWPDMAVNFA